MTELQSYKGYYLWHYVPSKAAAVIFALLFLAATLYHVWKIWRMKTYFCTCFALGGFFEFVGYCARASAHDKTGRMMPYCIQSVFILLGPALFAATIYMVLGRIIRAVRGEQYSLIRINWLTKVFVTGDVLSFVVQGGASGMMVQSSLADLGNKIVVGGLLIQVVMFGLFLITAIVFQSRMRRHPRGLSTSVDIPWKSHLRTLHVVGLLIMIRSVFRVAEFVMGNDGYLLKHEWTFTLLVLAKIVFADFSTHSLTTCDDGIFYWFDPNTGEICDPLDCGGGRAPPKTNVLACASYPGTYVTTISYLSCWTPPASATSTPVTVTSAESTTDTVATGKSTPTSPTTTSTATQVATGSSIMPSTTFPPSQSPNSKTHGNGTSSISGTVALSSSTNNKRHMLDGSLIAVAGAAIGAVALI
ncbi:hypothetical protein CNMCM8927_002652 [Aspergillus lentulus]|uniref:Protein RTM1 n=1 Tax=Aspergillus lentulus TaxID=293939 RepID=A0AAN5YXK0_ASPLE|nr:hypothetical protein CNMCM6069_009243 [Aspergillus lentulus]KAF4181411.1 hypothetical protein CNMCM7927_000647 [Aspergillus lentulus]KAF4181775.1 hypothetical protein CNMCM8060_008146 [Aspergillus lentulus]KAF4198181.1 hypothetical protein CNMCM8694_000865 [Aspergillus lentulus]KAF4207575.1 hypothetical protein CNMCM8927_002652 [Aspergillus lentulus]